MQAAGGLALLLPPDEAATEAPDPLLDLLDALILAGGSDVDPATYGAARIRRRAAPGPSATGSSSRWRARRWIARCPCSASAAGCRSSTSRWAAPCVQHLPDTLGSDEHRHTPGAFADHAVRLEPGSLAAAVAGAEPADDYVVAVKSHHHQGVDELGEGLVASGWSVSRRRGRGDRAPGPSVRARRPLASGGGGRRKPRDRRRWWRRRRSEVRLG